MVLLNLSTEQEEYLTRWAPAQIGRAADAAQTF